jgi:ligand-binding SRPBCC domain-containing protein
MAFTLWLGPLPLRWLAVIEQVTPISFVDRQLRGPFAEWVHLHSFIPIDSQTTMVVDRVDACLSNQWFWRLVGLGMWLGLPLLFAYRGWQTRKLLEDA